MTQGVAARKWCFHARFVPQACSSSQAVGRQTGFQTISKALAMGSNVAIVPQNRQIRP